MKSKITIMHKLFLFCLVLVGARFIKTHHYSFVFLFWNLFLAWLPLFFARKLKASENKYLKTSNFLLSILFLPNAPYILTDLFHLKKTLIAPLWFDLILILGFAALGLIYFILAIDLILREIEFLFPRLSEGMVKPFLFAATGYGIYLGRYLRYNSWDIVAQPVNLAAGIIRSMTSASCYKETWAVTITFTVFLYLLYEIYLSFKRQTQRSNELF